MRDPADTATADLLDRKTKAQRFRERQLANGFRQYAYWLTEQEAEKVKKYIARGRKK